jgi:hypothetical protein
MPSEEQVSWRIDVGLEDNRRLVGCDSFFATYAWMLPPVAVFGRSGFGRGFCLPECRSSLASRTISCLARSGFLSSLSRDEVPSPAEPNCTCPLGLGSGGSCFSAVISPISGRFARGLFQPATNSCRTAISFLSHARELRPTAYGIQQGVRRRAHSPAAVTDVTDMSAGVLRSSGRAKAKS